MSEPVEAVQEAVQEATTDRIPEPQMRSILRSLVEADTGVTVHFIHRDGGVIRMERSHKVQGHAESLLARTMWARLRDGRPFSFDDRAWRIRAINGEQRAGHILINVTPFGGFGGQAA